MSKDVSLEVNIGGQRYPLKVAATDEKFVRRAEAEIEEWLHQLKNVPGARNVQDHMAMLLITTWVEKLKEAMHSESDLRQLETKLAQTSKVINSVVTEKVE